MKVMLAGQILHLKVSTCLFVLNKRRLWDITPILEVSKVYSDLYNSLDLAKLQLWVSHCG